MKDKKNLKRLSLYPDDFTVENDIKKHVIKSNNNILDVIDCDESKGNNYSDSISSMFVNESFYQLEDFEAIDSIDFESVIDKIDCEMKKEQINLFKENEFKYSSDLSCNLTDLNCSLTNFVDLSNDNIIKNDYIEKQKNNKSEKNSNINKLPIIKKEYLKENNFRTNEKYNLSFKDETLVSLSKEKDNKNKNSKIYRKFSNINKLEIYLKEYILTNKIIKRKGYDLTRNDLSILLSSKWLNDKIINTYLELLSNNEIYVFSSYFYTNLKFNLERVLKYTKNINIFKYKLLYFPVHLNNHWIFVCFDTIKKNLEYRDSFNQKNSIIEKNIYTYLNHEYQRLFNSTLICNTIHIDKLETQYNGYDCGVYLLMYAKHRIKEQNFFLYKNMKIYRKIILHEIILDKIIYDINYSFNN